MKTTIEILTELETILFEKFPFTKDLFLPGLTDEELDEFAENENLELPESFRALYKWRGGNSDSFLGHVYLFPTLEQISDDRSFNDDEEMIGNGDWSTDLLPVMRDQDGEDSLVIDTTGKFSGEKGSILFWDLYEGIPAISYASLDHMLQTLVEKCKRVYTLHEDKYYHTIKIDNPGSKIPLFYGTSEEGKKIDEQINSGYPKIISK